MRALSAGCAAVAVILMIAAIGGMVTGRQTALAGGIIRASALLFFVAAVVLNIAAH